MKPTRRNVAVTAGLTAVLALSPVVGPAVMALADTTDGAAQAQSNEVSDQSYGTVYFYVDDACYTITLTGNQGASFSEYVAQLQKDFPAATSKDGYTFQGWVDENGNAVDDNLVISNSETFSAPDTLTVKASFAQNAAVHTINFHDEDGNGIGTIANAGDVAFSKYTDMLAEGVADPYKDGYTFDGWVTKSGDKILPTDVISGDLDLYPSFKKNAAVYTVNFFGEDGKGICTISLAGDHTLEDFLTALYQTDGVQVPFKDGCYIEWTTKSGDRVLSTDTIQGTLNLYANFKQSPATHTVNFFDKDGNGLGTIALAGDQPLSAYTDALASGNVEAPYVEGYTFTGWTTKSGDSVLPTDVISGDLNLYATYQKNAAVHTINFFDEDGNGLGTIANAGDVAFSVYTDMLAEGVQVPEKDGYIFAGWVTKSGDKILATDTISGDLNVYASYEKVSEPETVYHKVTFDDCLDSTENAVVVVEDGQAVAAPADPTCEGYTFQGWYSDTDLTQEWDFATPVTEDMTLWAKWEKNADESTPTGDETTDEATDGTASETPTTPAEQAAEDAQTDDAMPNTGDATVAVSGIAGLGAALAGVGAFLKRRRS